MSDPSAILRGMEHYRSIREARAMLADIINLAAFGCDRIVLVRRGHEVAAVVGPADIDFLREHKPLSRPADPAARPSPPRLEDELERIGQIVSRKLFEGE
jgi:prevent-host-death family protein